MNRTDVKNADERSALAARAVERAVEALHEPFEEALVARLGDCVHRVLYLQVHLFTVIS